MTGSFAEFVKGGGAARGNYLARLFALFSEEVVRTWCSYPEAPYEDLGRPTLCLAGQNRGHTLDFTLRRRRSDKDYVAEPKCELALNNFGNLTLTGSSQLDPLRDKPAFAKLLAMAADPEAFTVRRLGKPVRVDGAILVWGAMTPEGRDAVMNHDRFADVLSVESMVSDLQTWRPSGWADLIDRHRGWSVELFDFLAGPITPAAPATANEEGNR